MAHHTAPWAVPASQKIARNIPLGSRCDSTCRKPNGNQAHCTVCSGTFGTVSNFDAHRKNGWCVNPEEIGLYINAHGVWTKPMDLLARERLGILPGL